MMSCGYALVVLEVPVIQKWPAVSKRVSSLGLCIIYREKDISFSCPAAETVTNGAGGYLSFSNGHRFALIQLNW